MRFGYRASAMKHSRKLSTPACRIFTLIAVVLFVGCGKREESVAASSKPGPILPDETKTFDSMSAAQTKGVSVIGKTNAGSGSQILQAVRTGNQPGMDRIVFQFNDAGLPEWEVKYVERPFIMDCGSGEVVPVAGNAWLQITFRGAQAHTEAGEVTGGPRRRVVDQIALRELVRTCDFEGEVTWVAGLMHENEYTPRALDDPSRLVIDIAH